MDMNEDRERLLELAKAVVLMRKAQREYFKGRSPGVLAAAKQMEAAVDRLAAEALEPPSSLLFPLT